MVTRRDLLSAAAMGAVSSPAIARTPTVYPFYAPDPGERKKMLAWTAAFRARYNNRRFDGPAPFGESLMLQIFGKSFTNEKAVTALAAFRDAWGRMLTPATGESIAFRPEGAILFYVTALETRPPDDDAILFRTMMGSHDCISIRIRFGLEYPANRVGNHSRVIEIGVA